MVGKLEQAGGESLHKLSEQERRLILAYRSGKAEKSVNLLIGQELLPSSFPTRPDRH